MAVADNIRSDVKFMRLAVLLEPEISRMLEGQVQRTSGHDDAHLDAARSIVTFTARGQVVWEARAEVIGSYLPDFGLWRWWWTGRVASSVIKVSMDLALSEGQRHGVPTITTEHPRIATEADATLLANVTAQLARADGVYRTDDDEKTVFYALFDSGRVKRGSMIPPSPIGSGRPPTGKPPQSDLPPRSNRAPATDAPGFPKPPRHPSISAPPPQESRYSVPVLDDPFERAREGSRVTTFPRDPGTQPRNVTVPPPVAGRPSVPIAALPVREPSREIFMPVAQIALGAIAAAFPEGFHQGLLVLTVDVAEGKARFSALIVATGESRDLVVIDSPRELFDATAKMIGEDARSGNGRWRRLTARLARTARGASVDVTVV